jgi:hypothetical protein
VTLQTSTAIIGCALGFVRAELATLRTVFPHVALLARIPVLSGQDGGNVVAVASRSPIPAAQIEARLGGGISSGRCRGARTSTASSGTHPC